MKNVLKYVDGAGNIRLVQHTGTASYSLICVKDIVLNETKFFEKGENALKYYGEEGLISPKTGKKYKRLYEISTGLKTSNRETQIKTEELKDKIKSIS